MSEAPAPAPAAGADAPKDETLQEPDASGATPVGPPRDFRRILRRFGPAVVAIGIAVFASPLADRWPSKQTLEVALDQPGEVTRVSLEVAAHGEADPVFAATWNFDAGTAPPRIQAEMTTPNGTYDATIAVVRKGGTPRDEVKRVDLDGNRTTLFAR